MATIKGILFFSNVFQAEVAKGGTEEKFGCSVLLPANDPQLTVLKADVEAAKLKSFPSGYTGANECLQPYDEKYAGKSYYDPRFSGWWVFSCSSKKEDRPDVVTMNYDKVVDPSKVYAGMVAYVCAGISGYVKGKGGIGGWLNAVMIADEEPPMGRLDGRPSIEQMFSSVAPLPSDSVASASPPPAPPAAPVIASLTMTAAANGTTYQQYVDAGWSDEQMIQAGVAIKPSFA